MAYESYSKAVEREKSNPHNLKLLFGVGSKLEKWEEMKPVHLEFLKIDPENVPVITQTAKIYFELGELEKARYWVEAGLNLSQSNDDLLKYDFLIRRAGKD